MFLFANIFRLNKKFYTPHFIALLNGFLFLGLHFGSPQWRYCGAGL